MASETDVIMLCGHCGNQTAFEVKGAYSRSASYYNTSSKKWRYYDEPYSLLRCRTCSHPMLVKYLGDEFDEEVLYPVSKTGLTNVPTQIEKEYKATLQVRHISSNACAVLARRTLEAIFSHENAAGRTLSDKVNDLIKSERIPPLLADVAHLGRQIGNLGAHFDKEEVTEADVTAMIDFLETILEYLYVLPAKVATVKARFTKTP